MTWQLFMIHTIISALHLKIKSHTEMFICICEGHLHNRRMEKQLLNLGLIF